MPESTFFNYINELKAFFFEKKMPYNKKMWNFNLLNYLCSSLKENINLYNLANEAKNLTLKNFGKQILIYVPVYISNYCINSCIYCGFNKMNNFKREKLSQEEIEKEYIFLKNKGFDIILILTGEDPLNTPVSYIADAIKLATKFFSQINIETYPLSKSDYQILIHNGLYGITLYQETYDEDIYKKLHIAGPKRNFKKRISSIEDAICAGIKEVNIGVLLGLNSNWQFDVFMTICHALYLHNIYPHIEINISYPRFCETISCFKPFKVNDLDFIKIILLTRIALPFVGINLTTRERASIRDMLMGYGITKISAESKTNVGGYYKQISEINQFETEDNRTLEEILLTIKKKGLRPELTNWIVF